MAEPIIPPETLEHFRILSQKLRDESIRACVRANATHERFNVFTTAKAGRRSTPAHPLYPLSAYRQVIIARICQTPITFAPAHKKDGQASAQNDILENRTKTGQLI